MEALKTNLKAAAMALERTDTTGALKHIAEMQRLVLLAKLEVPANLEAKPDKQRDAYRAEFRKDLVRLMQELLGMELEVLDGDWEKAFGRVAGPLFRMREAAHEKYQDDK
jgi:hypothetical protein